MIKFFRNIRRKMLTENKVSKYLLYALGEILLVVIGILIALQINNLNEERKANIFENKLLEDLSPFIETNLKHLRMSIRGCGQNNKSGDIILTHLENNLPYHDSLDHHFSSAISWNQAAINNSAYETLKTYGMNTIRNDSLRIQLGNLYESGWFETINIRQQEYYYSTASPILAELFKSVIFGGGEMKPNDYEELQNSKRYATVLRTCIANRNEQIMWYRRWSKRLEALANMITIELKENGK